MKMRIVTVLGGWVSVLFLAGSWVGEAQAVECVSPDLSLSCYRTIQEALTAAAPGEEVSVYPGTYSENVSIDTDGVRVVGHGWWPGQVVINPADGVAFSLKASQTTLKNLSIRGGETGIVVTGAEATINDVHVWNSRVGISILSDEAQIINSKIRDINDTGISAAGAGLLVQSSVVQRTGGACLDVNGDGARVEESRMVDCGREGVKISGSAALVLRNEFRVAGGDMIYLRGPGAVIRNNRLEGGRRAAISVFSDTPIVVNNSARDCDSGIDVFCDSCDGGRVAGNISKDTYNCPGFIIEAASTGLRVWGNTSSGNSDQGFSLSGVGMIVRRNRAFNNGADGFDVYSSADVQLLENKAFKNSRNGIRLGSSVTGTVVRKNYSHNNGDVDFYDAGTGTIRGHNSFGTVGGP